MTVFVKFETYLKTYTHGGNNIVLVGLVTVWLLQYRLMLRQSMFTQSLFVTRYSRYNDSLFCTLTTLLDNADNTHPISPRQSVHDTTQYYTIVNYYIHT